MTRAPLLLSVALTIGASQAIKSLDPAPPPEVLAQEALRPSDPATTPDLPKAIRLYTEALHRDPANPYRWSDLASAYHTAGQTDRARACYTRTLQLSGQVPQLWLRVANFHFDLDESHQAIPLAAKVLQAVSNYDDVLFSYFDQLLPDPAPFFIAMGRNRRAINAYTQHLVASNNLRGARTAWRFAQALKFNDDRLTASYLDGLLRAHRFSDARHDWVVWLGPDAGNYPSGNLLFNAGFERDPTGSPLDWRITPSDKFETLRDNSTVHSGKSSLRIHFLGTENVSYTNLSQLVWITPGRYLLTAWIKTDNLTTNEGLRLELNDAEVPGRFVQRTDPINGTHDWRQLEETFTLGPKTALLSVRVVRDASRKFDNKINGIAWLDDLVLKRL